MEYWEGVGWEAALTVQRVNLKWEWVKQGGNEKTNETQKVKAASTYSSYNVSSFQVNRAASADQQVKSKISISVEKTELLSLDINGWWKTSEFC